MFFSEKKNWNVNNKILLNVKFIQIHNNKHFSSYYFFSVFVNYFIINLASFTQHIFLFVFKRLTHVVYALIVHSTLFLSSTFQYEFTTINFCTRLLMNICAVHIIYGHIIYKDFINIFKQNSL